MEQFDQQVQFFQETQPARVKYAGFWIRWAAFYIDGLILSIPIFVVKLMLVLIVKIAMPSVGLAAILVYAVVTLMILWAYSLFMIGKYQATFGKKIVGIRVASDVGEYLTSRQIILRETIGKLLSSFTLGIGYVMAGFTVRKQALHDRIAGTVVVYDDPDKKTSTAFKVIMVIINVIGFFYILQYLLIFTLFGSLYTNGNKNEASASDASSKADISSIIASAILYQDQKGTLNGFTPNFMAKPKNCNDSPNLVVISSDGQNIAIFEKSCVNKQKYFCGDLVTKGIIEVDEDYTKNGRAICPEASLVPQKPSDITSSENMSQNAGAKKIAIDSYGLFKNAGDDVTMLRIASEAAKKWQPDAQVYLVTLISTIKNTGVLPKNHSIIFKSNNEPNKIFVVNLDFDNKITYVGDSENQIRETGYIKIDDVKFNSAEAFQKSEELARTYIKYPLSDYSVGFTLLYSKEFKADTWVYTLQAMKTPMDYLKVSIDASSGEVLGADQE